MVQEEIVTDEGGFGMSTGALVATAIGAGVIAYMIRRARQPEPPKRLLGGDGIRASELRDRTATATREFVLERLLPELKPVLLELLKDAKGYVDDGFKRVERVIKNL